MLAENKVNPPTVPDGVRPGKWENWRCEDTPKIGGRRRDGKKLQYFFDLKPPHPWTDLDLD